jgi:hypothetical protein
MIRKGLAQLKRCKPLESVISGSDGENVGRPIFRAYHFLMLLLASILLRPVSVNFSKWGSIFQKIKHQSIKYFRLFKHGDMCALVYYFEARIG